MQSRLSVIIPTFNRPEATARAVASACASVASDAEILVIDDASTPAFVDNSGDSRVRVLRHAHNRGAAAARNTGLANAQGEWVAFLDSDDVWIPEAFAARWIAAQAMARSLTISVCGFTHVDARSRLTRYPRSSHDPLWFASGCWFCPGSTALFHRGPVLDAIGLMDETLGRLEDLDWFLRLALAGGGVACAPVVGAVITRGANPSRDALSAAIAKLHNKYVAQPSVIRARLNAYAHLELAACDWRDGRRGAALAQGFRSWCAKPRPQAPLEDFWRNSATALQAR